MPDAQSQVPVMHIDFDNALQEHCYQAFLYSKADKAHTCRKPYFANTHWSKHIGPKNNY